MNDHQTKLPYVRAGSFAVYLEHPNYPEVVLEIPPSAERRFFGLFMPTHKGSGFIPHQVEAVAKALEDRRAWLALVDAGSITITVSEEREAKTAAAHRQRWFHIRPGNGQHDKLHVDVTVVPDLVEDEYGEDGLYKPGAEPPRAGVSEEEEEEEVRGPSVAPDFGERD